MRPILPTNSLNPRVPTLGTGDIFLPEQLKTDALATADIRNLALQRTASLIRLPGPAAISPSFEVWKRLGSDVLLDIEARLRKAAIITRCFQDIEIEFSELFDQIELPNELRLLDIGCGIGVMDVLWCRRVPVSRLALVDIETTDTKHHGYRNKGAGYNSLSTAAAFVADNIPAGTRIETVNPNIRDVRSLGYDFNLITSYLSCGYHYPAATYFDVFQAMLAPGGQIIIDLRLGQDHRPLFDAFEIWREISVHGDRRRVVLSRRNDVKP